LLVKWWWKLESKEGLWQKLVRAKYLRNRPIACVTHRQGDSFCWNEMLKVKILYLENRTMVVGDVSRTSFWLDVWCSQHSMKVRFPDLYEICEQQFISV
jgi:hypothetical protein